MNSEKVQAWLAERKSIEEAEAELKERKAAHEQQMYDLVKEFDLDGVQSLSIDGHTVYMAYEMQCSVPAANKPSVIAWAKENGLGDSVREEISTQTIKSYLRECMGEERDLERVPEELRSRLKIHEGFRLNVLKSK